MADLGARLERDDPVAEIVLAPPERQNAIGTALWRALATYSGALAADPAVRA